MKTANLEERRKNELSLIFCMESDILKHLLIWKEWEKPIRKALVKSAEYLLQTPDFKGVKNINEIEPETALLNIMSTYLKIPRMIKVEAETRARHKMAKLWKEVSKVFEMSYINDTKKRKSKHSY